MSAYTKQAIKNSFLKLLNDRPLNQVTVKAIVEDCGINRNTFYYHFTDIPSLATEIITERADQIIRQYANPDSPEACLNAAVQFMTENRRAVMHMYRSISHDTVAFYLMQICRHTVEAYAAAAYGDLPVRTCLARAPTSFPLSRSCFSLQEPEPLPYVDTPQACVAVCSRNHHQINGRSKHISCDRPFIRWGTVIRRRCSRRLRECQ